MLRLQELYFMLGNIIKNIIDNPSIWKLKKESWVLRLFTKFPILYKIQKTKWKFYMKLYSWTFLWYPIIIFIKCVCVCVCVILYYKRSVMIQTLFNNNNDKILMVLNSQYFWNICKFNLQNLSKSEIDLNMVVQKNTLNYFLHGKNNFYID